MELITSILFAILFICICGIVYVNQQEKNKRKNEATTRFKHRNLN